MCEHFLKEEEEEEEEDISESNKFSFKFSMWQWPGLQHTHPRYIVGHKDRNKFLYAFY